MKLFILIACFIAATYACYDKIGSSCKYYKEKCKSRTVRKYCQRTCKRCVDPQPPSGPLITQAPGSCGLRQVASGKVIGGKDAKPGDWPWQVLLKKKGSRKCGGTIINKRYVITAAHCISAEPWAELYSVVVGENNRTKPEGTEKEYQAERVVVHPEYNKKGNNDIAIIKLDEDIKFGQYVQPACLPDADIAVGSKNCFITGWGKIEYPGFMHTKLQQANMPPVRNDVCYAKNKKRIPRVLTAGELCAGEGGVNPIHGCHGDSGGPYICKVNGRWELHGAVSYGSPRCRSTEAYTVFARIKYFRQWISDQMRYLGDFE